MSEQVVRHFINGEYRESASGKTRFMRPSTVVLSVKYMKRSGRGGCCGFRSKSRADGSLGQLTAQERAKLLHRVADRINERFDEFLDAECLDTGKPRSLASHIDIPRGAANFKIFADLVQNILTESFRLIRPTVWARSISVTAHRRVLSLSLAPESSAATDDLEGRSCAGLRQHGHCEAV